MNPGIRILPLPSCRGLLGRRMNGWKQHEGVERKREYYPTIIYPERNSDGTLLQHSLPQVRTYQQAEYLLVTGCFRPGGKHMLPN